MNYILNSETVNGLNHLISRNNDAANGFVEVSNNVNYPNLTQWLIDWAKVHEQNKVNLKSIIENGDGEATSGTSFLGELHHAWIDLKAQFTNNDTAALLDECLTGQEKAIKDYEEVLAIKGMPSFVQNMVKEQKDELKESMKSLNFLKSSYKKIENVPS